MGGVGSFERSQSYSKSVVLSHLCSDSQWSWIFHLTFLILYFLICRRGLDLMTFVVLSWPCVWCMEMNILTWDRKRSKINFLRFRTWAFMILNQIQWWEIPLLLMIITFTWLVYKVKKVFLGQLGDLVGWVSESWFWLRSWSRGCEIEPWVRLGALWGACLRLSLSLVPSPCSHVLYLSNKIKSKKKFSCLYYLFNVASSCVKILLHRG